MRQRPEDAKLKYGNELAEAVEKLNAFMRTVETKSTDYKVARRIRGWLQKEHLLNKKMLSGEWRKNPAQAVNFIIEKMGTKPFSTTQLRRINLTKGFSEHNILIMTVEGDVLYKPV